ncbi:MAG: hypothetical protein EBY87_00980 [Actinobacteria bacterium]|nr:hypothetical protein [Actinomycetota bacterium]
MAMPSARSGLLRANLTVTSGTALSRVTGLIRIIIFGIVIGQTALADAYDIANNAPNVVYELLLGGILTATLVPLFTRYLHDSDDESINAITSFAFVALAVITTIAIMLAPLIFKIFSLNPADTIDADLFRQAGTMLTRLLLLQIFFYGVTSICTSILHARKQFFAAAWSPVLANLVTITSLLFVSRVSSVDPPTLEEIVENSSLHWLLGMGSTSGIIVMALALVFALRRSGTSLKFKFNRTHDAVRQLLKLSGWAVAYIAANQVTLVVIKNLANGMERKSTFNTKTYSVDVVLSDSPSVVAIPAANVSVQNETNTVVYAWGSAAQRNLGYLIQQVPVRK